MTQRETRFAGRMSFLADLSERRSRTIRTRIRAVTVVRLSLFCTLLWSETSLSAPQHSIQITCHETWNTVFAGETADFHFPVLSKETFHGMIDWGLTVGNRTIQRGEQALSIAPDRPATVEVKLTIPPVKAGVRVSATLLLTVYDAAGNAGPLTRFRKNLVCFSDDPFAGRQKWLKSLDLRLFDPDQTMAKILDAAAVPFSVISNLDSMGEAGKATILVAENISADDYPALFPALVQVARQGAAVLWMVPQGRELALSGTATRELLRPDALILRRQEVIGQLDKTFDAEGWPPNGRLVARSLQLASSGDQVVAATVKGAAGWPWLAMTFAGQGKLVVCGFPLISRWTHGPTPRYLFVRILEWLNEP